MERERAMEDKASDKTSVKKPTTSADGVLSARTNGICRFIAGFATALGIHYKTSGKSAAETGEVGTTVLAHQRTDLAMDRTYWAAQRTLMGWIRTALSMISFGFTIGKLGQTLHDVEVKGILDRTKTLSISGIAYFLVILGTIALLGAAIQYSRRVHDLCERGMQREMSIEFIVALVLSVMGMGAFTALITKM
jgi:putative membrane protein